MPLILRYLRAYRKEFVRGLLSVAIVNALSLSIPWLLKEAIESLRQARPLRTVSLYALSISAIALVLALTRTWSRLFILGASRRIVYDILRDELKYEGVILSDDLEMKAIAAEYEVPSAAVLAIQAGCDGALICSGDHDTQAAALEALVHAVEGERVPMSRIDDAMLRQRRAKERFLAAPVAARPLAGRALREALGRDDHRAVADEMARFL